MNAMTAISEQRAFGGVQGFYQHVSPKLGTMRFSVFVPSSERGATFPVVYYLAGLTCTEETFVIKAGAQRVAAELGLMLVTCDTSTREHRLAGDDEHWDFGRGASFYLDATEAPFAGPYEMATYVTEELRTIVEANFPIRAGVRGIFGHSMGGHGALTLALRNPGLYQSVSAFAPIVAPSQVPWGQKAFARYLGENREAWLTHDATALVQKTQLPHSILIDQGLADKFLEHELRPELFEAACKESGQKLVLHRREGYDHSYYFIATFVESHLQHHAANLGA
jgi:S-formylglutathione hydrolase